MIFKKIKPRKCGIFVLVAKSQQAQAVVAAIFILAFGQLFIIGLGWARGLTLQDAIRGLARERRTADEKWFPTDIPESPHRRVHPTRDEFLGRFIKTTFQKSLSHRHDQAKNQRSRSAARMFASWAKQQ